MTTAGLREMFQPAVGYTEREQRTEIKQSKAEVMMQAVYK